MTRRWLLIGLLVVAAVVTIPLAVRALIAPSSSTSDCPAQAATGNAAGPVSTSSAGADYWTPERMRSAAGAPQPTSGGC